MSHQESESGAASVIRRYLPELIYGANDGIVTTFAIVSGIVGASISRDAILILGFASLFADGISMAASDILSERSKARRPSLLEASRHGAATFIGFVTAGFVPLLAYLLPAFQLPRFAVAALLAAAMLFFVGASRSWFSDRSFLRAGIEMLLIGAGAAVVAFGVGYYGAQITGYSG